VRQYTKNMIEKLGARNRTHAAVMFVRSASWTEKKAAV
jgi:DNA-binding CsgD family transcriptional regulator